MPNGGNGGGVLHRGQDEATEEKGPRVGEEPVRVEQCAVCYVWGGVCGWWVREGGGEGDMVYVKSSAPHSCLRRERR